MSWSHFLHVSLPKAILTMRVGRFVSKAPRRVDGDVKVTTCRRTGQKMGTFDPMAIAVDWLDAYRAESLDALIGLYQDKAAHYCGCDGRKLLVGKQALRAYWINRFQIHPAYGLIDVKMESDGVSLSYSTNCCVVQARLVFDEQGKIKHVVCGPETKPHPISEAMRSRE